MRATGRDKQLTRQIGEHLVAAELGRRGFVATPFAGNVPMFDLLAADADGRAVPIQVKAIKGASWQFRIDTFLAIEIQDDRQKMLGKKRIPNVLCIFVLLKDDGKDEFYIFRLHDLQSFFFKNYKDRRRPKNPQSMHCAVWPTHLKRFRDNWKLVQRVLRAKFG